MVPSPAQRERTSRRRSAAGGQVTSRTAAAGQSSPSSGGGDVTGWSADSGSAGAGSGTALGGDAARRNAVTGPAHHDQLQVGVAKHSDRLGERRQVLAGVDVPDVQAVAVEAKPLAYLRRGIMPW